MSDVSSQAEGRGAPPMSPAVSTGSAEFRRPGSCGNVVGQEIEPRRNEAGRPSSRRVGEVRSGKIRVLLRTTEERSGGM